MKLLKRQTCLKSYAELIAKIFVQKVRARLILPGG